MQKNVCSIFMMDSEPCRVISQRAVSQGSPEDKGWKQVRKKIHSSSGCDKEDWVPSAAGVGLWNQKARELMRWVKVLVGEWSPLKQQHLYLTPKPPLLRGKEGWLE